ncbi:MAG TPA: 3-oxoacyl-ACP reductase, partial [Capillimicrobium sp.]
MPEALSQIVDSPVGRALTKRLGVPEPATLRRYEPGQPLLDGPALVGGEGRLRPHVERILAEAGADAVTTLPADGDETRYAALVFDASGLEGPEDLRRLYEFFHPTVRRLRGSGRVVVLGAPPAGPAAIAQRALEGFVRSLAKELKGGATAMTVLVEEGAESNLDATLRFILSSKSAYVDAQVVRVGSGESTAPADWEQPLAGRVALVTGASRGIGAAIAEVLARDGAEVVCLDVPAQGEALTGVANRVGGTALQLDVTADDAPQVLADHLRERHGGVDVVVHNAGITRDRTLARMSDAEWDVLMAVNLVAPQRLTEKLVDDGLLRPGGRVVCVSSMSGIAGNRGQANYAASKAGIIGLVEGMAPRLAPVATINAVAPGFIETEMTAAMPFATREVGKRMNSLAQGGKPVDVAETIAWLASPAAGGVNGNTVRVCGQNLLG